MKTHIAILDENTATSKTLFVREIEQLLTNEVFMAGIRIHGVHCFEAKPEIGETATIIFHFTPDANRSGLDLQRMAHAADGFLGGWLFAMRQQANLVGYAAQLGRLGGQAKSEAKTKAVRENARRPRPNRKKKAPPTGAGLAPSTG